MWVVLLFYSYFFATTTAGSISNDGPFKVYRIVPSTNRQLLKMIEIFETAVSEEADFWHAPSTVNSTIDVMVGPEHTTNFERMLEEDKYIYHVAIKDLKKLLVEKESFIDTKKNNIILDRLNDDSTGPSKLRMGEYYSYQVLLTWMERMAERVPGVSLVEIGTSVEGRRIVGLRFGEDDGQKRVAIIDGGIHAREWAAIHTATYFMNQMINDRNDPHIADYWNNLVLYIFPILNPDGYEYTRTDKTNPRARMWRKSRSAKQCAFDGISNACCHGVDLNRNFAFRFAEVGASRYPCSEIYHGPSAFSEPEARALKDFMVSQRNRIDVYITLHAYSQLWIYSYSHRKFTYAPDFEETKRVAALAVAELGKLYGTKYRFGTGPEIIYAFSGGSTDWAKETLKVKYSYTIELRPVYEGLTTWREGPNGAKETVPLFDWNGFVLEKSQLIPTAKETWAGVKVVLDEVSRQHKTALQKQSETKRLQAEKCADRLAGCMSWISSSPNICRSSPQSMVRDCAKSCDLCHLIVV